MLRRRGEYGVLVMASCFFIVFIVIVCNFFRIAFEQKEVPAAGTDRTLTIEVGDCQGTVYDRQLRPLTNSETKLMAAAVPSSLARDETASYAVDRESFLTDYEKGKPFVFECTEKALDSDGLTVFEIPVRYSADQPAQHIIGYLSDNKGADGIEYAYDSVLRNGLPQNSVSYTMDGSGRVLIGDRKQVFRSKAYKSGVVLTLDKEIQKICEECGKGICKGAIVCADIKSGDILGMASFPDYSTDNIEAALTDPDSPLINRAIYSYSVGSVFKLVTAAAALESGEEGYVYECDGSIDVSGRIFNCHKLDGHGLQDMTDAMINSCNTYFISLSQTLDISEYRKKASCLGFGRENYLCAGITGSGGVLPSEKDLSIPAELANFAFGQGKLTATPLQVTQLTCAIANDGKMPVLKLIKGLTPDGSAVLKEKRTLTSEVMSADTAKL